ncbi:MAG: glycosyltransferase family 4 protein [Gammaproteobacteria bacterium]|nr:glycosyltransferase family 4 protein [Gammaproteobacteria bacterium]
MNVLIAHPGLQHAYQLAWALHEHGHVPCLLSGVPVAGEDRADGRWWRAAGYRPRRIPLPASQRRSAVAFPLARRLAALPLLRRPTVAWNHRVDRWFDRWASRQVRRLRPDVVIGYENACLQTLNAARRLGACALLDAASIHFTAQSTLGGTDVPGDPHWVLQRKRAEIAAADALLTCSEFAAATYRDAGVPADKVFAVSLGAPPPHPRPAAEPATRGASRFLFVGSIRRVKGVDLLLDLFDALGRREPALRLSLVGKVAEADLGVRARAMANVELCGQLRHDDVLGQMRSHDCLLLPSRFDGFGMVVGEALSQGLPVIVSERVGAKVFVERFADAGRVIALDASAWRAAIDDVVHSHGWLAAARRAARTAAASHTWADYRRSAVAAIEQVVARHAAPTGGRVA